MSWEEPSPSSPPMMGGGSGIPSSPTLERLGLNMLTAGGVALSFLLYLIARLFDTIYYNNRIDGQSAANDRGLLHTSSWLGYAAAFILVASLLVAALTARSAHWGVRVIYLALGISILLAASGSSLSALFGSLFSGMPGF